MGLRAGLDWCGKSRHTGIRSPDRPARRQSLYRLRYPAQEIDVLILCIPWYLRLPDGDLSVKHVGWSLPIYVYIVILLCTYVGV